MESSLNKKPAILLIDDDKDLLEILRRKLVKEGCVVNISQNGAKISEMIVESTPDCILLDIHMEGINGTDICKKLKSQAQTSDIPVLLLSANHNIEKIAALCGADGYISKPLDIALFARKIKDVLKLRYFL
ncbi:response regulator [Ferruginibacter paludis]|uniref:response regulator n=1 Tax=Ferruginibacter TaxID=1004303 RepID=UPI0025B4836A|nr:MULTISPECIES: response regulator [Ferruginibacter]MDB5280601.1 response regulator [Ferruginibacter sp.]MDN3659215.1 response regulator [Ferruginibacter paludis]